MKLLCAGKRTRCRCAHSASLAALEEKYPAAQHASEATFRKQKRRSDTQDSETQAPQNNTIKNSSWDMGMVRTVVTVGMAGMVGTGRGSQTVGMVGMVEVIRMGMDSTVGQWFVRELAVGFSPVPTWRCGSGSGVRPVGA